MCTSYSFRGGSKRERRACDVFELKIQRWIQERVCGVFECKLQRWIQEEEESLWRSVSFRGGSKRERRAFYG